MKKLIVLFIFSFSVVRIFAQDPHFSQFFASPLTLNPALTGKFDGKFRVAGNYRNQWPEINKAFVTSTASIDFHVLQNSISEKDNMGIGLMGYTDNSAGGAVKFNYAALSAAYHLGLDEDGYNQIGMGFQATYANMNINTSNLKFEDQLTTSGFTGVTSEIFSGANLKGNYVDLNAGLLYSGSSSEKNYYYGGISMYHINKPKQSFTGADYSLNARTTFHAGGYFPMGEITTLHVSALHSIQGGAHETVVGGAAQFRVNDESAEKPTSFFAGSWLRLGDAIIPYVGLEFGGLRFGATYDVNTSALKTASNSKGGIELSLIYVFKPSGESSLPCPKF